MSVSSNPSRAQKCLFGTTDNLIRRNSYNKQKVIRTTEPLSEDESDLGPMSPLGLSDENSSSCDSSPERQIVSSLTTLRKSSVSRDAAVSWDYLTLALNQNNLNDDIASFRFLKKLTKAARSSPHQKILSMSPKSAFHLSSKNLMNSRTPTQSRLMVPSDKVIPHTPQRHFAREMQNDIVETPHKNDSPEQKLITPLGSENKMISLPKLHKRKSFNASEIKESFSPKRKENMLKRHAHEILSNNGSKLLKTDENYSVPKARAALFQEKKHDNKLENLTLSTKSFYSNNSETKKKSPQEFKYTIELTKHLSRRSFPAQSNSNKRSSKNHKLGGFNAGVSHAIRKPRFKSNSEIIKKEIPIENATNIFDSMLKSTIIKKRNMSALSVQNALTEIDPNKRFFKSKRMINSNDIALKTVNGKMELKVQKDKTMTLGKLNGLTTENVDKKSNLTQISFDTTDLTVDEPEFETSLEQSNVANILKVLEDDWADDDYDTMGPLSNQIIQNMTSPEKSTTLLKNITMSPASELSNMASSMNIEDVAILTIPLNDSNDNQVVVGQKYYPIFNKGYSSNKVFEESGITKSPHAIKKNVSWQLSIKRGKEENQYQIDAGQEKFGAMQCSECGIVYQLGDPEDENAHLNYHNSINILKFSGWKTERVIMKDALTSSRIILVESTDTKQYWNKVLRILAVVDRDLGLVDTKLTNYQEKKVYLYIRDKNVLGVLVAEYIKTAHRMIPELLELDCCTAESTPAKCGINIIWTVLSHRRQGIATKLIDTLRAQFYYGYIMSMDDIAFSIPTPSGKVFAEKYTKTRNFKVYS